MITEPNNASVSDVCAAAPRAFGRVVGTDPATDLTRITPGLFICGWRIGGDAETKNRAQRLTPDSARGHLTVCVTWEGGVPDPGNRAGHCSYAGVLRFRRATLPGA